MRSEMSLACNRKESDKFVVSWKGPSIRSRPQPPGTIPQRSIKAGSRFTAQQWRVGEKYPILLPFLWI
ncbi:hypothetical protein CEXT_302511 [Caerostris extrusa]|uniref:Uncharacterized protein n=1 Tax=Caerostris extrusa TaxID=172846 RepID=A0AAV4MED0_CAEEX|nr:hypothetical protein CEXT_302511 [Caerostris extrusa]